MSVSFLYALAQVTVATSLAILAVTLARKLLGWISGAQRGEIGAPNKISNL